jgi:threonine/homoserine/homoserine lactone efflux protein
MLLARFPINIAIQTVLCLLLGVLSTATWTLFGSALRPVLKSEAAVRAFNVLIALLLLASLYPVFRDA